MKKLSIVKFLEKQDSLYTLLYLKLAERFTINEFKEKLNSFYFDKKFNLEIFKILKIFNDIDITFLYKKVIGIQDVDSIVTELSELNDFNSSYTAKEYAAILINIYKDSLVEKFKHDIALGSFDEGNKYILFWIFQQVIDEAIDLADGFSFSINNICNFLNSNFHFTTFNYTNSNVSLKLLYNEKIFNNLYYSLQTNIIKSALKNIENLENIILYFSNSNTDKKVSSDMLKFIEEELKYFLNGSFSVNNDDSSIFITAEDSFLKSSNNKADLKDIYGSKMVILNSLSGFDTFTQNKRRSNGFNNTTYKITYNGNKKNVHNIICNNENIKSIKDTLDNNDIVTLSTIYEIYCKYFNKSNLFYKKNLFLESNESLEMTTNSLNKRTVFKLMKIVSHVELSEDELLKLCNKYLVSNIHIEDIINDLLNFNKVVDSLPNSEFIFNIILTKFKEKYNSLDFKEKSKTVDRFRYNINDFKGKHIGKILDIFTKKNITALLLYITALSKDKRKDNKVKLTKDLHDFSSIVNINLLNTKTSDLEFLARLTRLLIIAVNTTDYKQIPIYLGLKIDY